MSLSSEELNLLGLRKIGCLTVRYVDTRTGLLGLVFKEDMERVRLGYACGRCGEGFPMALWGKCPTCSHTLNPELDLTVPPQHWLPDPSDA